jgi:hypothetical protein
MYQVSCSGLLLPLTEGLSSCRRTSPSSHGLQPRGHSLQRTQTPPAHSSLQVKSWSRPPCLLHSPQNQPVPHLRRPGLQPLPRRLGVHRAVPPSPRARTRSCLGPQQSSIPCQNDVGCPVPAGGDGGHHPGRRPVWCGPQHGAQSSEGPIPAPLLATAVPCPPALLCTWLP